MTNRRWGAGILVALIALGTVGCATHGLPRAGETPQGGPDAGPSTRPATTALPPTAACRPLHERIRATYVFKPSRLSPAQQDTQAALMDQVWKQVQDDPLTQAPCLRAALADPAADPFFLFDGSALLVAADPGLESKALQVRLWTGAPLEDLDLRLWVETLALRGYEGFDVSAAGARWLEDPARSYRLPGDGGVVDAHLGALFLFGSLAESQATPALIRIAENATHPGRRQAVWLLVYQMTPQAVRALRGLDVAAIPDETRAAIQALLTDAPPRRPPGGANAAAGAQARDALRALIDGDGQPLEALRSATTDRPLSAALAGVLTSDDVPLLRQARRRLARTATVAAADDYMSLSTSIGVLARPR